MTTFDYREKAPRKSTKTMYLGADGQIVRSLTSAGYLAPGVPGTVRGLELAHKKFGKLPWKDVVAPSVALADGFTISAGLARSLNREVQGPMAPFPASVAAFGKPGGGEWAEGDRLIQGDLAKTLAAIGDGGADAFYKGWIADRIADDMKANGGLITKDDLAAYKARERAPVRGTYKGYDIISMAAAELGRRRARRDAQHPRALRSQVEGPAHGTGTAPADRSDAARLSGSRAPPRRSRLRQGPGRPADVEGLREDASRHPSIPAKASSSVELGKDIVTVPAAAEPDETTHFSVIDRNGLAVTSTYTLEGGYGSHVVVKGAGFLLNNEMGDFNKKPGETNVTGDIGTPANQIAPGKTDAELDDADDGRQGRQAGAPHRLARRADDHQYGVHDRARRDEYGLTGRAGRRPGADASPVAARPRDVRRRRGARGGAGAAARRWATTSDRQGRQGDAHSIWIAPDGTPYGVRDKRTPDSKASVPQRLTAPAAGR